jgi:ATP-binding cassette subfamily B (MDR/TAP) protein 1
MDPTLRKDIDAVGFFKLFRFADRIDMFLMVIGSIAALADGAAMPLFVLLWGNMTDAFGASTTDPNASVDQAKATMWNFLEIGLGVFFASWLMFGCWMVAG